MFSGLSEDEYYELAFMEWVTLKRIAALSLDPVGRDKFGVVIGILLS